MMEENQVKNLPIVSSDNIIGEMQAAVTSCGPQSSPDELNTMSRNFAILQIKFAMQTVAEKIKILNDIDMQIGRVAANSIRTDINADPRNFDLYREMQKALMESIKFSQSLISPFLEKGLLQTSPFEQDEAEIKYKRTRIELDIEKREKIMSAMPSVLAELDVLDAQISKQEAVNGQ